jgi:hypothetical protein
MERKTMKYYKLLTQEMTSHNYTTWEIGVPITIAKKGVRMCSDQVLHCYNHPLLAVIFNSIHADIFNPKLFEISVDKIVNTDGLKFASKSQTLIKEISLPEITLEEKIEFAIKVAKLVYKDELWNSWADAWLRGQDCSKNSASAVARDARDACDAADAADAAARAAYDAACAAACAAADADAADAADAAYRAARAAADAARAAASANTDPADTAYIVADIATCANNKNEFNQKMIDIIEEIIKVKE